MRDETAALIQRYRFELRDATVEETVERWLTVYPPRWVRTAAIEALYQGRYKAVSVEQVLMGWARRGHPSPHFTGEFERLVLRQEVSAIASPTEPRPAPKYSARDRNGDRASSPRLPLTRGEFAPPAPSAAYRKLRALVCATREED